jgi:hypothetical protein
MASFTLDAGPLIAADRGDRRFWRFRDESVDWPSGVTIPAPVLAQVWRGAHNANLVRALRGCQLEMLEPALAFAAGALCGRAGTSDAVDAIVVASAALRGDAIITTDPDDLRALAQATGLDLPILDLNDL